MMAHELLRQAALILAAGHSNGANARSIGGSIVDLHIGANRATLNPDAAAFSPYGAICKAASQNPAQAAYSACDALGALRKHG